MDRFVDRERLFILSLFPIDGKSKQKDLVASIGSPQAPVLGDATGPTLPELRFVEIYRFLSLNLINVIGSLFIIQLYYNLTGIIALDNN